MGTKQPKKHWFKCYWFLILSVLLVAGAYEVGSHFNIIENQLIARQAKKQAKKQTVKNANEVKQAVSNGQVTKPQYVGSADGMTPSQVLKLAKQPNNEALRGYVSVPSYGINEPIYEGVSPQVLALGVGVFEQNATFGQGYISLFGHNMGDYNSYYPTKFSAMQNMSYDKIVGKDIIVTVGNKTYKYEITNFERGVPVDTLNREVAHNEQYQPEKPTIQLVACDEDADFQAHLRATNYTDYTSNKRLVLTGVIRQ